LRGNCVIEGKIGERIKGTGRLGKRRKQLLDDLKETRLLEIERGGTGLHHVENCPRKRLWNCRKTDWQINE